MRMPCPAKCLGCGRPIRCVLCGGHMETLPALDNKIFTLDGMPVCFKCIADLRGQSNEVHPLTTKHGSRTLELALQKILTSEGR